MAAAEKPKPELTPMQRNLRSLGLFFLVFLGPLLLLRGACVTPREVCEHASGHYGTNGEVHVCSFESAQACPAPYHYARRHEGCVLTTQLPGVARWETF